MYEDPQGLAFMEIHPAAPGDLLVIPTAHAAGLEDIDGTPAAHLFRASTCRCGAAVFRLSRLDAIEGRIVRP